MDVSRPDKKRRAWLALLTFLVVSLLLLISLWEWGIPIVGRSASSPDSPVRPDYGAYDYGEAGKVVNVATQPVAAGLSVIAACLEHDSLLRKTMKDSGLEVRFHYFLKGADLNAVLLPGKIDVAMAGDLPALTAAAESDALVVSLQAEVFNSILAREHILMRELRGKRVGCAFGSNAHFTLLEALATGGLTEKDIRRVDMDITEMPAALSRHEIDAFAAWEPTPTTAQKLFPDLVVVHRSLSLGFVYFSNAFAQSHPEALREILAAELRALTWFEKHPDNFAHACRWALATEQRFTGRSPVLDLEQYMAMSRATITLITPVPLIPRQELEPEGLIAREFSFLRQLGRIPAAADWNRVRSRFDSGPLMEVLAAPRKYELEELDYLDTNLVDYD